MTTDTSLQIAARLPADLVGEIDRTKAEDCRKTRTDQLEYLLRVGLKGRARLAELERLATQYDTTTKRRNK